MKPLTVRSVRIGEGRPKICAPLTGETTEELKAEAEVLTALDVDMAEWRVDCFSEAFSQDSEDAQDSGGADTDTACSRILDAGVILRNMLGDIPLLFTLRTKAEGGKASVSPDDYEKINALAAASGLADLLDVELFTEGERFADAVKALHLSSVKIVGSSHDFCKTPSVDELISRMNREREGGADICKIAVMPAGAGDVLNLLSASLSMKNEHPDIPLITVSMGKYGLISRFGGEYFGSDITFASAAKASAPGQIGVEDCRYIMSLIHDELSRD